MSDWTYEMLRYAFSWNNDGASKALSYIYESECGGQASSDHLNESQYGGPGHANNIGNNFGPPGVGSGGPNHNHSGPNQNNVGQSSNLKYNLNSSDQMLNSNSNVNNLNHASVGGGHGSGTGQGPGNNLNNSHQNNNISQNQKLNINGKPTSINNSLNASMPQGQSQNQCENDARVHLLNTLLASLFSDDSSDTSSSALIFLDEHCETLLGDNPELIEKTLTVLEKYLVMPAEDSYELIGGMKYNQSNNSSSSSHGNFENGGSYNGGGVNSDAAHSVKGHVIVTYTSLLIQTNCIETDPIRIENFVDYLYDIIADVNDVRTRMLRMYACEALSELESWYSGLLFPLLGSEWRSFHIPMTRENSGFSLAIGTDNNLQSFVNDELLHIAEAYSRLFLLVFDHFTREVISCQIQSQQLENLDNLNGQIDSRGGYYNNMSIPGQQYTSVNFQQQFNSNMNGNRNPNLNLNQIQMDHMNTTVNRNTNGSISSTRSSQYHNHGSFSRGPSSHHDSGPHGTGRYSSRGSDSECSSPDRYSNCNSMQSQFGDGRESVVNYDSDYTGRHSNISHHHLNHMSSNMSHNNINQTHQINTDSDRTYKLPSYARRHPGITEIQMISYELDSDSEFWIGIRKLLPRRLLRLLTRSISLVLEAMPSSSSWAKIQFAKRLGFFIHLLSLQTSVVYHHFAPLVHSSSAALIHALLTVTRSSWSCQTSSSARALLSNNSHGLGPGPGGLGPVSDPDLVCCAMLDRLFSLVQDVFVDPFFRGICTQWLISLTKHSNLRKLILGRYHQLCPKRQDPLELKELKLQLILHCLVQKRISQGLHLNNSIMNNHNDINSTNGGRKNPNQSGSNLNINAVNSGPNSNWNSIQDHIRNHNSDNVRTYYDLNLGPQNQMYSTRLTHNSTVIPKNLLCVLESLSEFKSAFEGSTHQSGLDYMDLQNDPNYARALGAHAVVMRFLLRVLITFPDHFDYLNIASVLCDLLRSYPRLMSSILIMIKHIPYRAIQYALLRSFGDMMLHIEPASKISSYFGFLLILSSVQEPCVEPLCVLHALKRQVPLCVLHALKRFVKDDAGFSQTGIHSWALGMKVLALCRQIVIFHPQHVIYEDLSSLLQQLTGSHPCVDVRDQSAFLLRVLHHVGSCRLRSILSDDAAYAMVGSASQYLNPKNIYKLNSIRRNRRKKVYQYSDSDHFLSSERSVVLPNTVSLAGGPVPFISFYKSLEERRQLRVLDGQCAVFFSRTRENHQTVSQQQQQNVQNTRAKWEKLWAEQAQPQPKVKNLTSLDEYLDRIQPSPIRLPFCLEYISPLKCQSDSLNTRDVTMSNVNDFDNHDNQNNFPDEIFSLEISFSEAAPSCNFIAIDEVYIPYMAPNRNSNISVLTLKNSENHNVNEQNSLSGIGQVDNNTVEWEDYDTRFPQAYKILLKVEVREPVPQIFDVNVNFSDREGTTYFGALESFALSFQDLFIPMPSSIFPVSRVFELFWSATPEQNIGNPNFHNTNQNSNLNTNVNLNNNSSNTTVQTPSPTVRLDHVESQKILFLPRAEVHARIQGLLWPFLIEDESLASKLVPEAFDFEQEECFDEGNDDQYDDNKKKNSLNIQNQNLQSLSSSEQSLSTQQQSQSIIDSQQQQVQQNHKSQPIQSGTDQMQVDSSGVFVVGLSEQTKFDSLNKDAVVKNHNVTEKGHSSDTSVSASDSISYSEGTESKEQQLTLESQSCETSSDSKEEASSSNSTSELMLQNENSLSSQSKLVPNNNNHDNSTKNINQNLNVQSATVATAKSQNPVESIKTVNFKDKFVEDPRNILASEDSDPRNILAVSNTVSSSESLLAKQRSLLQRRKKIVTLNLETKCVMIFIPPRYHLALRFTISENTTLCRIRTDRFNLLSYMDRFFWADFLKPVFSVTTNTNRRTVNGANT